MPDPFSTTDLALASFLSLNGRGFRVERNPRRREKEQAIFIFEPVSETEANAMILLVNEYQSGSARVEPRRFMREVASVRGQLYDLLDGKKPH